MRKDDLVIVGVIVFIVLGVIYLVWGSLNIIDVTGNLFNTILGR